MVAGQARFVDLARDRVERSGEGQPRVIARERRTPRRPIERLVREGGVQLDQGVEPLRLGEGGRAGQVFEVDPAEPACARRGRVEPDVAALGVPVTEADGVLGREPVGAVGLGSLLRARPAGQRPRLLELLPVAHGGQGLGLVPRLRALGGQASHSPR